MKTTIVGIEKGDLCNRDGCKGIIDEHEKEGGCSCHISPPCGYCTEPCAYCETCGWDDKEEFADHENERLRLYNKNKDYYESENRKFQEQRDLFYKKFRGELEITEFDYRKESHSNSSMRVLGVHPEGFNLNSVMDKINGTFGGRFEHRGKTNFIYIAYTD